MVLELEKYSFGAGDRFGCQGEAQLEAFIAAAESGVRVTPVWNKSHREHTTIGTQPESVRREADAATAALNWRGQYFVDADHINSSNVDAFLSSSDFFTLDVADAIGQSADGRRVDGFVDRYRSYLGGLEIPGVQSRIAVTESFLREVAFNYLYAVEEAAGLYRKIAEVKGDDCIIEVSMDETSNPQHPAELFFILAAIADAGIPAQTIAPKFSGRFNKGVDYVGEVSEFAAEFDADTAVVGEAVKRFGLPENLKLSVHSGSDKFSIYPAIRRTMEKFDSGLHLKTAGTTWLEECIGLAESGGSGLAAAKEIYSAAYERREELSAPYASVIDIDQTGLPEPREVADWSGAAFAAALRHDRSEPNFNPSLRQLLHVGYKVAAEMGDRYQAVLEERKETIGECVKQNILERHMRPLFL